MISNVSGRQIQNNICASGSVGGARPCQGRGRGFESRLALFKNISDVSDRQIQITAYARVAQLVEHDLAKVGAAGSSPVSRSLKTYQMYLTDRYK